MVTLVDAAAVLSGTGLIVAVAVATRPPVRHASGTNAEPFIAGEPAPSGMLVLDSLHVIVDRDPFRFSRAPAPLAYDPLRAGDPPAPLPTRPVLWVSGIVWSRSPMASLEGLPGSDGPRLVRTGQRVGEFTVRRITRAAVVVTGMDTVWTLSIRELGS